MWYLFVGFIIGTYSGKYAGSYNYKYYESLNSLQQNEINKLKKFLLDKKMENEYIQQQTCL